MKEEYYLIKEAAAMVGVESHVLRYWEEELKMDIHRNEMGHRYYTKKDIEVLSKVRDLKEKGLQLKAIRNYLEMRREQLAKNEKTAVKDFVKEIAEKDTDTVHRKQVDKPAQHSLVTVKQQILSNEEKMEQFQQLMNRIVSTAIQENNDLIGKSAGEHAANAVATQITGMTKEQEARAEERFQKLDQTLREIQRARLEAAAANMRPVDRRRQQRLKRKNNQAKANTAEKHTEQPAEETPQKLAEEENE